MLRTENSPSYRSGNLLCGNLGGNAQSVNCNSLGHSPSSHHLESSSVGEDTSAPTPSTFMVPMLAPSRNFQMFDPIEPMASEYYAAPPSVYTSHPPQFSGYCPTANSRFTADAYGSFGPTPQHLDNPIDFGRIFYEPITAPQPPIPPAAPGESVPPNSVFNYHRCQWLGGPRCDGLAPGKNREMGEHLRVYHLFIGHERDTVQCEWQNCGQTMQRMNVPRHIVSRHLLAAARCRFCGKRFSRPDVVARHERTCAGVLPVASSAAAGI